MCGIYMIAMQGYFKIDSHMWAYNNYTYLELKIKAKHKKNSFYNID
jgi:hypothetical protein